MTIKELEEKLRSTDKSFSVIEDKNIPGRYIVLYHQIKAIILNHDEEHPWAELDWPMDIYYDDIGMISDALYEVGDWLGDAEIDSMRSRLKRRNND